MWETEVEILLFSNWSILLENILRTVDEEIVVEILLPGKLGD
jgi:hypothetical protein